MQFKLQPYPHQIEALKRANPSVNEYALFWEMGCIAEGTLININSGGCGKKLPIEKLHESHSNGHYQGAKVRSFNGDNIRLHPFSHTLYKGEKECVRLVLEGGHTIVLTPDHEVLTRRGFVPAGELTSTDLVGIDCYSTKAKGKKRKKPSYLARRVGDRHPYAQRISTTRSDRGHKPISYLSVETHRLVAEASLNNLELNEFIACTKGPRGEKLKYIDPSIYHVHHKDHNHRNNSIDNLEVLDKKEHLRKHGNYAHFGQGEVEYKLVKSVRPVGIKKVYDIVCHDPHRNFVANGIVVHNCGKTGGIINILRQVYASNGALQRTLILSPLVTLFNWKNEFNIHSNISEKDVVVLDESSKRVAKFIKEASDDSGLMLTRPKIFIVNYEALTSEKFLLAVQEWAPEIMVLDESHYVKNPTAKRSKIVTKLADNAKRRYLLTGTPILNNIKDIYQQYRILDGGKTFGKNFHVFMSTYMEDENRAWSNKPGYFPKWTARTDKFAELTEKMYKKAYRVTKKEVLKDLPPFIETSRHVTLGVEQRKYYEQLKRDFVAFVKEKRGELEQSGAVVAQQAVTKLLRLMQITTGYVTTEDGTDIVIEKNPRMDECKALVEDLYLDHKIIIWCSFIQNYKMLSRMLDSIGVKHVFITGQQNLKQKEESMHQFRTDPDVRVVVANRKAAGIGINLVEADYSIVYSRNFSFGEEVQADARNHRGGSQMHEKITKINLLAKGTICEMAYEAVKNKQSLSERIIDVAEAL